MTWPDDYLIPGIEPYHQEEAGIIYCADCREILPKLPKVDLVLTDPPYGINRHKLNMGKGGGIAKHKNYGKFDWDTKSPSKDIFELIFHLSKNQIIWGSNHFSEHLPSSPCWFVWDKDNIGTDFADCELAFTSLKSAVRKFKWRWSGMLQENMKNKDDRFHPTQKPLALIKWCLSFFPEAQIICDSYLGSGTTAVAAKELGRKFIGIEISEEYCAIAKKRLRQGVLGF